MNRDAVIVCTLNLFAPERFDQYLKGSKLIMEFAEFERNYSVGVMTADRANRICSFVKKMYHIEIHNLDVCCDSEESRSAAVDTAILCYCFHEKT